jgi:NTP pyrophosphatase (non-canonical NTP hydrolase)
MMNISELIKEAHRNAVERGFYENPGTIDDKIMLIVSELGEALEADRKNKHADWKNYDRYLKSKEKKQGENIHHTSYSVAFNNNIKDTFEDEIADTFIRLFDFCGWQGIEIKPQDFSTMNSRCMFRFMDISSLLLLCTRVVADMQDEEKDKYNAICCAFGYLFEICAKLKIDIEKHVIAKMAYNRTRPYKHGKAY